MAARGSAGCLGGFPAEVAELFVVDGVESMECTDYSWCSGYNACASGDGSKRRGVEHTHPVVHDTAVAVHIVEQSVTPQNKGRTRK